MSCCFDLEHYRALIDAARRGGYRFAGFDGEPLAGDLYLRHDVDLDLEAALRMSELERELGVHATYFVMTTSVFYNLDSTVGREALTRLREDGHAVGLHSHWPDLRLDDRFDPLVS